MASGTNEEGEFGLQIAPMLDILFVLLLFFMVSAGTQKKERSLDAPIGSGEVTPDSRVTINIRIDADNDVTLNGSASLNSVQKDGKKPSELENKLSAIVTDNPDQLFLILPSPTTTDQTFMDVLNACSGAHVKNIAFSGGVGLP